MKDKKMTEKDHLKVLPEKILKGFRLLFIALTIGIITQGVTPWKWIDEMIKAVIFITTVLLIVITRKIEKRREKEEYANRLTEMEQEATESLKKEV